MKLANKTICNIKKSAFTLVEMSVVILIIAVIMASIIVSKELITIATVSRIQKDYRDFQFIYTIFRNNFDCIPGDCSIKALPQNIINGTPSSCFNLSTATGMGNSGATQLTGTDAIITSFNNGMIDQVAKRTCAFFELQTSEPSAFGGSGQTAFNSNAILGIQSANASSLDISSSNPDIASALAVYTSISDCAKNNTLQCQINANNVQIKTTIDSINYYVSYVYNNNTGSFNTNYCTPNNCPCPTVTTTQLADLPTSNECAYKALNYASCRAASCASNVCNHYCYLWGYVGSSSSNSWSNPASGSSLQLSNANVASNATAQATIDMVTNPNNFISLTIKKATQPSLPSSLKTQAMWDLRTAGSNGTSGFYPFELLDTTNLSQYKNQQVLIARDNSTNDITINTVAMPALNAQISRKLDIKFDDGKPYTGNIIAGQSAINKTLGTSCTTTSLATSLAAPIITATQWQSSAVSTANYINTNSTNLANGCVLGWLII